MQILFTKLTGTHHALELIRDGKKRERAVFETKIFLLHDFIHYAVETLAGVHDGVWGALADGKTVADLNDRTGEALKEYAADMSIIESIVGAFTPVIMGRSDGAEMIAGLENIFSAQGKKIPPWLNERFVMRVNEQMRQLLGQWKTVRFGEGMELGWK